MDRVVVVTKLTRFEELVLQHLTEGAAQFALESRGQSIDSYKEEHTTYQAALSEVYRQIPNDLLVASVRREDLPNFLFREKDLIVACGPDGLFVNLAKYVDDQLVLTVNPDPNTVAGVLMLFQPSQVGETIKLIQKGKHRVERLPFVKAAIDDNRVVWAISDLFIGRKDHIAARYELSFGRYRERQSSSGILIATGVGSTGWMRSIAAQLEGMTLNGQPHKLSSLPTPTSDELVFAVREPFPSPNTGTRLVTGRVTPGTALAVSSEMPDGGYVFSDGVVEKAVAWNAGSVVTISVGERYVQRIVP